LGDISGSEAARREIATGAGGDRTVEVDRLAEEAAVAVLEETAADGVTFTLLSEELGRRSFGSELPLVVLDPVDGSLNAKQGIPLYSTMLALAEGPTLDDVAAGHVANLVSGEVWQAARSGGVTRAGKPLTSLPLARRDRLEVVGLESSPRAIQRARGLIEVSSKLRILGSMALSIAHTAAGHMDAFCAPIEARLFDMSASLLMVRETGGVATDFDGRELWHLPLTLETRTRLVVSSDARTHARALAALSA
jgi:myo-inositol-1(or 4)-monophosphatase